MDNVHGFVEKFKEDFAAHIWFRDGGVHLEDAECDHLKRFRKRPKRAMTIESNPKYLDVVLVFLHTRKSFTTGELLSPAETTVYRQVPIPGSMLGKPFPRLMIALKRVEGNETFCQRT